MQEAPLPLPTPILFSVMLNTSRYLPKGPKSRVEKSTVCRSFVCVCVCSRLWPLFHLHVWCSRVAAGEAGEGGWWWRTRATSEAWLFLFSVRRRIHRLRSPLNPLSCSGGKSADGALFHPLSSNPAGCESGGNNPGLGTPAYGESVGGPTVAGVPHPSQSAAPGASRLPLQPIH